MSNSKQTLTLEALNEKLDKLSDLLHKFLKAEELKNLPKPETFSIEHDGEFKELKFNFKQLTVPHNDGYDETGNYFVKLTPIFVAFSKKHVEFSFTEFSGSHKLVPQNVSKYKNALIDGKVRSVPNVAPNFNQMSYIRFEQFIKWAGGVMLNWKTVLYLQILWLFIKKTKETKEEDYKWNTERYTGYQNTGKGIGEFLGIEQLFSGYTFFSLENNDDPLFALFKLMGMEKAEDYNDKYGYYRKFFDSRWYYGFDRAWSYGVSARLCKNPFEGVEEENLPFQDVKED